MSPELDSRRLTPPISIGKYILISWWGVGGRSLPGGPLGGRRGSLGLHGFLTNYEAAGPKLKGLTNPKCFRGWGPGGGVPETLGGVSVATRPPPKRVDSMYAPKIQTLTRKYAAFDSNSKPIVGPLLPQGPSLAGRLLLKCALLIPPRGCTHKPQSPTRAAD